MKQFLFCITVIASISVYAQKYPLGNAILDKIDANMSAKTLVMKATMQISGARAMRTMSIQTWTEGANKSFTEYLAPARDKGTKMLKLYKQLWIYTPSTDRTIQISGHMLRQSVMGSDMSYEDMMEDETLRERYAATVAGEEVIDGRKCWVVNMQATKPEINYYAQKIWVDKERYIPLRMQLFAKSGKQLKEITLSNVQKVQGRWYPKKMVYKDVLKDGNGTVFLIEDIRFNTNIPASVFNKSNLK